MCSCGVLNCRDPSFIFWITACYLKVQASCKMYLCSFFGGGLFCRLIYISLSQSAEYAKVEEELNYAASGCGGKELQTIYETRIWVNFKTSCALISKLLGAFLLLYQLFTLTGAEWITSTNPPFNVYTLYYKCRLPIPIISSLDFQLP